MLIEYPHTDSVEASPTSERSEKISVLDVGDQFRRVKRNMLMASTISLIFSLSSTSAGFHIPGLSGSSASGPSVINGLVCNLMLLIYLAYTYWEFRYWNKIVFALHSQQMRGGAVQDINESIDEAARFFKSQIDKVASLGHVPSINDAVPYNYNTARFPTQEIQIFISVMQQFVDDIEKSVNDKNLTGPKMRAKIAHHLNSTRGNLSDIPKIFAKANASINEDFANFRSDAIDSMRRTSASGQRLIQEIEEINRSISNMKERFGQLYDGLSTSQKSMIIYHDTFIPKYLFYLSTAALFVDIMTYRGYVVFLGIYTCNYEKTVEIHGCPSVGWRLYDIFVENFPFGRFAII